MTPVLNLALFMLIKNGPRWTKLDKIGQENLQSMKSTYYFTRDENQKKEKNKKLLNCFTAYTSSKIRHFCKGCCTYLISCDQVTI